MTSLYFCAECGTSDRDAHKRNCVTGAAEFKRRLAAVAARKEAEARREHSAQTKLERLVKRLREIEVDATFRSAAAKAAGCDWAHEIATAQLQQAQELQKILT